jgi:hypothetical protein
MQEIWSLVFWCKWKMMCTKCMIWMSVFPCREVHFNFKMYPLILTRVLRVKRNHCYVVHDACTGHSFLLICMCRCYGEVHLFFYGKFTLLQLARCMDVLSIMIWSSLFSFFDGVHSFLFLKFSLVFSLGRRREREFTYL